MANREPDEALADTDPRWKPSPTKIIVSVILLAGIVVPLLVGTYASVQPRLFGFPYFYWYQLAWVFLAAGCCALSFALLQAERRRFERDHPHRSRDGGGSGDVTDEGADATEGQR